MVDPVTIALALSVLQVVTPVAIAAMPAIWKGIEEVLRWVITKAGRNSSEDSNLACINTILDTLDRLPNLSWTSEKPIQALLTQIKIKTDSLIKMIENDSPAKRFFHKGKFAKNIQSIVMMMQLLETNVRVRQATTFYICNANNDVDRDKLDLNFYMQSQENLIRDLQAKLCEDNLEPVFIETRDFEASIERSGVFPEILYEFQSNVRGSGYPKTLATSRGVRDCIELLMRWLRDLKLRHETQNTRVSVPISVLVGVALYETFTMILPEVLMDHLVAHRLTLNPRTAQQFSKNLRFFRSFLVSSTFSAIEGPNGLRLEEEDKVLNIDLEQPTWMTWDDVQRMSLEVETRSRDATRTASENIEWHECILCGLYIAVTLLGNELAQHWEACFRREERLNPSQQMCCPVCELVMDHLLEEERDWHTNTCLDWNDETDFDNDESGFDNDGSGSDNDRGLEW